MRSAIGAEPGAIIGQCATATLPDDQVVGNPFVVVGDDVVLGERKEVVVTARIPIDDHLGELVAIAPQGVRVQIALVPTRLRLARAQEQRRSGEQAESSRSAHGFDGGLATFEGVFVSDVAARIVVSNHQLRAAVLCLRILRCILPMAVAADHQRARLARQERAQF